MAEFVPGRARPCIAADEVGVLQGLPDLSGVSLPGHRGSVWVWLRKCCPVMSCLSNHSRIADSAKAPRLAGYLTHRIGVVVAERLVNFPVGPRCRRPRSS